MDTFVFTYKTRINATMKQVWSFFSDATNIEKVHKRPKVRVCKKGEKDLESVILLAAFQIKWKSVITDERKGHYFIDEANNPPFPFSYWRHKHSFERDGDAILMVDEVSFRAKLPASIIAKGLTVMFKAREKQIHAYFQMNKAITETEVESQQ
ncbi:SRPBCC family protein [Shouchella tritolerans]|uniref:SRPBCC family protein n=1 Tax=Shouchella tritolerans TaxID=2979466 RepID=UPI0021E8AA12|nr:hypothetical protein [Shouchella tritolerans]